MSFTVIIPARFASSRLPGKPLADIAGCPMIEHVYRRALLSDADHVLIATDDQRIVEASRTFDADVCLTSHTCASGTDRLQEAASVAAMADNQIVVNVQGDEPLIPPAAINQVAAVLQRHPQVKMATLAAPLLDTHEMVDSNVVKVVINNYGRALYFSRAPIPWVRDNFSYAHDKTLPTHVKAFRHIGIYAYRVSLLHQFVQWQPSMLEQAEQLEQLRMLENGVDIQVAQAQVNIPLGIDTEQDLANIRQLISRLCHT